jgi:arylsulfatase A-like enzyme
VAINARTHTHAHRRPGIVHAPGLINGHRNVTTPAITSDFLPTIMELLGVTSPHPEWAMDGISLLPYIANASMPEDAPRPADKVLGFSWQGQAAIIDNNWKLMTKPTAGQCDYQEPCVVVVLRAFDCVPHQSSRSRTTPRHAHPHYIAAHARTGTDRYASMKNFDDYYLFNLADDYHELHDQKKAEPARLAAMQQQLTDFLASIQHSQKEETKCAAQN